MSKRRTKKDKQKARHSHSFNWDVASGKLSFEPGVNRQLDLSVKTWELKNTKTESADDTVQATSLGTIKKDIGKSLILAGIILASELVIYLFWK